MENKNVFISVMPYWGHVNPILGIAQELVNRKANVIFYSLDEMKDVIEKTGAQYRKFPYYRTLNLSEVVNGADFMLNTARVWMECGKNCLQEFSRVVENENIDLIIYDQYNFFVKYLLNHLKFKYKTGKSSKPAPPAAIFSPSFAAKENVYPITDIEKGLFLDVYNPEFLKQFDVLEGEQELINKEYDMDVKEVFKLMNSTEEKLVLTSVLEELHPHRESFDSSYHFVGPCFLQGRHETIKDAKLKSILDLFPPINPKKSIDEAQNNLKLVYVSLGTVFNENTAVFETIIDAYKSFDEGEKDKLSDVKLSDLRIVLSVGSVSAKILQEKIDRNEVTIPNNILIVSSAPQLEILRRASVYITHCGMNSTNEGLHYGVPLICVPVVGDQPLVAYRVCDELKLAKRFNIASLSATEVKEETHEIFKNKERLEKVIEFSKISNKYNGVLKSVELIEKYLS